MVPCPFCNAPLFGSPRRCYKCGKDVNVDDRSESQKQQAAEKAEARKKRLEDPQLRKRFSSFITALENGIACVVDSDNVFSGEDAWAFFVENMIDGSRGRYTCLRCSSCSHVVVRSVTPGLDDNWITRGDGTASANNWKAFFNCPQCNTEHRGQRVTLSLDTQSALGEKTGDPLAEVFGSDNPWWKIW